jgi:NADP-dependent 3-hydroxy acid dehydrogenase YdfG
LDNKSRYTAWNKTLGLLQMKVAITGGTAGIGQAMADIYQVQGHEVLRLSRRNGHNIRSVPKIAKEIEPCDVFVNNAQAGFAQTELLFEMAKLWQGTNKHIIVISSMMTNRATCPLPGLDMSEYYIQKTALELAVKELREHKLDIKFTVVRPGNIATSPDKTVPPALDVVEWAQRLMDTLYDPNQKFTVQDISIG